MTTARNGHTPSPTKGHGAQRVAQGNWGIVIWNDDVNLREYFRAAFCEHFGFDDEHARALTETVFARGHALAVQGTRERMEAEAQALCEYGLRATVEQLS